MHPLDPASFNHKSVKLPNGHTYHYVDEQPSADGANGYTIMCFHGFPDLWFGYRYQIPALVKAGYRVIVPSQLGYHETSKPSDVKQYAIKSCADDMAALLKAIGVDRAIVIGHDWGGWLAYRFAEYHPDITVCVAVICTPYTPPSKPGTPFKPIEEVVKQVPNFNYQLFFQSSQAIELFDTNPLLIIGRMGQKDRDATSDENLRNPKMTKEKAAWATQKGAMEAKMRKVLASGKLDQAPSKEQDPELAYYYEVGKKNSFRYPLNWYKTREYNHIDEIVHLKGGFPTGIPVLFVGCGLDAALPPAMSASMPKLFPNGALTMHVIPSADHWVLQDKNHRDQLNQTLIQWFETGKI